MAARTRARHPTFLPWPDETRHPFAPNRSTRQKRSPAVIGIGNQLDRSAVKRFQVYAAKNCAGCTFANPDAFAQQIGSIGGPHGGIWIMRREQNAMARGGQCADFTHHLALVAEIEARGRLVEHDELRLLRQCAGEQHELPLAAGGHRVGTLPQMRDAEPLEHARGDGAIGSGRPAEQVAVRGAPHQHHRFDGEGEGDDMRLRHISEQAGTFEARIAGKWPVAEPYFARLRRQEAEQRLEQRRLAAAVRTQEREHFAGRQRDIEMTADHVGGVADGEIVAGEDHGLRPISSSRPYLPHAHVFETLAKSQMKNGVPTSAVRMPSGISVAVMVRASVSIRSRNPPPSSAAAGMRRAKSGPTRVRAICGTTSPPPPMMPAVATLAEVTSVAATTMAIRSAPVGTPSARASSSGSAITFMRQRNASKTKVPSATGPKSGTRSVTLVGARLPSSQNVMAGSWLYGSAMYFRRPTPAPSSAPMTTPVRTSTRTGSRGLIADPIR